MTAKLNVNFGEQIIVKNMGVKWENDVVSLKDVMTKFGVIND